MFVLLENSTGYAIFKVLDESILSKNHDMEKIFAAEEETNKVVQLHLFRKFADSSEATKSAIALNEGVICKSLEKLLKRVYKADVKDQLMVWDPKLASSINEKMNISVSSTGPIAEMIRCIKTNFPLIPDIKPGEVHAMSLGIAHHLAHFKLKFSSDKVDKMIVESVTLLKQLNKKINLYIGNVKDLYGCHFPELAKLIPDNTDYIKTVLNIGDRSNVDKIKFSKSFPEELVDQIKNSANFSVGIEVSKEDLQNVFFLCKEIQELSAYRLHLNHYISVRMGETAPNLTIIVGELLGAHLIALAGSLSKLSKMPASTVQLLGAGRSLFSALKHREATPKCGIIYRSPLVCETTAKFKGRIARSLATKAALAARCDAMGDDPCSEAEFFNTIKDKLYSTVQSMEDMYTRKLSGKGKNRYKFDSYKRKSDVTNNKKNKTYETIGSNKKGNHKANIGNKFKVNVKYAENKTVANIKKIDTKASKTIKKMDIDTYTTVEKMDTTTTIKKIDANTTNTIVKVDSTIKGKNKKKTNKRKIVNISD